MIEKLPLDALQSFVALAEDLLYSWKLHEPVQRFSCIRTRNDEVKIADSFATPAQASGYGDLFDFGSLAQIQGQFFGYSLRVGQQIAPGPLPKRPARAHIVRIGTENVRSSP